MTNEEKDLSGTSLTEVDAVSVLVPADAASHADPAFPVVFSVAKGSNDLTGEIAKIDQQHVFTGMSLRDYFAAKALTGLMGGGWQNDGKPFDGDKAQRTASIAYQFADAMLMERAK